jgi:starch-binding outer membrane protein, SusD/RagB family
MKTFRFLFINIFLLLIILSCDDVLDRAPLDKIKADEVFSNQGLASAYITDLYARLPSTDFMGQTTSQSDESTRSTGNSNNVTLGTVSKTSEAFGYWDYTLIRDINNFIDNIQISSIEESVRQQLEGEARFLRAYVYFEKAKRYGGVPLVDIVINPFEEIDIKYTQRSTEEAIFNFIDSELTQASNILKTDPFPREEQINGSRLL